MILNIYFLIDWYIFLERCFFGSNFCELIAVSRSGRLTGGVKTQIVCVWIVVPVSVLGNGFNQIPSMDTWLAENRDRRIRFPLILEHDNTVSVNTSNGSFHDSSSSSIIAHEWSCVLSYQGGCSIDNDTTNHAFIANAHATTANTTTTATTTENATTGIGTENQRCVHGFTHPIVRFWLLRRGGRRGYSSGAASTSKLCNF